MVQVIQNGIFGDKVRQPEELEMRQIAPKKRGFKPLDINDGCDEKYVSSEYMLILRIIQKRILSKGLTNKKNRRLLLKIVHNEMKIKTGNFDPVSSTRDSLVNYLCC